MRSLLVALVFLAPAVASAQIRVEFSLPTITFEVPPPLVVVTPGVQVVEDYDEEVFVVDGIFWCQRDGRWFRSHDHHGRWVYVEHDHVPRHLRGMKPGKYRHYKRHGDVHHASGKKGKWKGEKHHKHDKHGGKHKGGHGKHKD